MSFNFLASFVEYKNPFNHKSFKNPLARATPQFGWPKKKLLNPKTFSFHKMKAMNSPQIFIPFIHPLYDKYTKKCLCLFSWRNKRLKIFYISSLSRSWKESWVSAKNGILLFSTWVFRFWNFSLDCYLFGIGFLWIVFFLLDVFNKRKLRSIKMIKW